MVPKLGHKSTQIITPHGNRVGAAACLWVTLLAVGTPTDMQPRPPKAVSRSFTSTSDFSAPNGAMQIIELRPMDTKRSGRARLGARLHHSPKPRATLSQPLTGPCRLRAPFCRLFGAPISPKSRKKARSHAPWVLFLFIIIGTYIICLGEIGGSRRRNTAPNFSEPNNTDYDK